MDSMARIAALYDIHGNLPALDAVLAEIERLAVDAIVVGGDVIPGPMPAEVLDRLLALTVPTYFIAGNGEHDVLTCLAGEEPTRVHEQYRGIVRWTAEQLRPEHARAIARWPITFALDAGGLGSVLFCHATPRDDNEIFTRNTPDGALAPVLEGLGVDLLVCGHTHMQFDRIISGIRVVNAGSVGMPLSTPNPQLGGHTGLPGPLRASSCVQQSACGRNSVKINARPCSNTGATHCGSAGP